LLSSMTGYGRGSGSQNGFECTVELRSVNHRYADFHLRMPRELYHLEDRIRRELQQAIKRGRVEATITLVNIPAGIDSVRPNFELAGAYCRALQELARRLELKGDIGLEHLMQLPDILCRQNLVLPEELVWPALHQALAEAITRLVQRRRDEGDNLARDLAERCRCAGKIVQAIADLAPLVLDDCRARLEQKLKDFLSGTYEENRVLLECAILVERMGIDEELVRLKSHLQAFEKALATGGPAGRKLDFIIQEMFREANTIGSKAGDYRLSSLVVELKTELGKIREQIQNIE